MKKWVVRLAIITIATVAGAAGAWWYLNLEPAPTTTTNVEEAETPASSGDIEQSQRKLPVLGKEIPGLPEFCADKLISVSGCDGQTEITTDQGNTYRLVEIGDQCWFADNAKEIPDVDTSWYGYYDNAEEEPSPGEGMLYTWDAAMNGETRERAQGICPDGWHIPSACETFQFYPKFYEYYQIRDLFPGARNEFLLNRLEPDYWEQPVWKHVFRYRNEGFIIWNSLETDNGHASTIAFKKALYPSWFEFEGPVHSEKENAHSVICLFG